MTSIRKGFTKLFPDARHNNTKDGKETVPISLRTVSGKVRVISAEKYGRCPICQFDPRSNVMPIFLEHVTRPKRYNAVRNTANMDDCACCTLILERIAVFEPGLNHLAGQFLANWAEIGERTTRVFKEDFKLFALDGQSFLPLGLNTRALPTGDTSSKLALDWIKGRLPCALNHSWCGDGSATSLPD